MTEQFEDLPLLPHAVPMSQGVAGPLFFVRVLRIQAYGIRGRRAPRREQPSRYAVVTFRCSRDATLSHSFIPLASAPDTAVAMPMNSDCRPGCVAARNNSRPTPEATSTTRA